MMKKIVGLIACISVISIDAALLRQQLPRLSGLRGYSTSQSAGSSTMSLMHQKFDGAPLPTALPAWLQRKFPLQSQELVSIDDGTENGYQDEDEQPSSRWRPSNKTRLAAGLLTFGWLSKHGREAQEEYNTQESVRNVMNAFTHRNEAYSSLSRLAHALTPEQVATVIQKEHGDQIAHDLIDVIFKHAQEMYGHGDIFESTAALAILKVLAEHDARSRYLIAKQLAVAESLTKFPEIITESRYKQAAFRELFAVLIDDKPAANFIAHALDRNSSTILLREDGAFKKQSKSMFFSEFLPWIKPIVEEADIAAANDTMLRTLIRTIDEPARLSLARYIASSAALSPFTIEYLVQQAPETAAVFATHMTKREFDAIANNIDMGEGNKRARMDPERSERLWQIIEAAVVPSEPVEFALPNRLQE